MEDHKEYPKTLAYLGELYRNTQDYELSESFLNQSADKFKSISGTNSNEYAVSLYYLALLKYDQKNYNTAQPLCEQAYLISLKNLGPNHPTVIGIKNDLDIIQTSQPK